MLLQLKINFKITLALAEYRGVNMKNNPIVHFEIPADNVDRAKKFYNKIFGWQYKEFDMPDQGSTEGDPYYGVITTEVDDKGMPTTPGAINGGLMKRKSKDQPFMNYINVESIDEMLPEIKKHGGSIRMPKTEIGPGMGWIAAFTDTEGNLMGLHEMHSDENAED